MRAGQTLNTITDKLRDTAKDAGDHLSAATGAVNDGLRETADTAAGTLRQSAKSATETAEAALNEAAVVGRDIYKGIASRAGDSVAGLDRLVAKNPLGAIVAALGLGLVVGLLARR